METVIWLLIAAVVLLALMACYLVGVLRQLRQANRTLQVMWEEYVGKGRSR